MPFLAKIYQLWRVTGPLASFSFPFRAHPLWRFSETRPSREVAVYRSLVATQEVNNIIYMVTPSFFFQGRTTLSISSHRRTVGLCSPKSTSAMPLLRSPRPSRSWVNIACVTDETILYRGLVSSVT